MCRRYFPDRAPAERRPWAPLYRVQTGDGERTYTVPGVSCDECPVSYIEPIWAHLVRWVARGWWVRELTGIGPLQADQSRWPARLVDALELISMERQRVEAAETAAITERAK